MDKMKIKGILSSKTLFVCANLFWFTLYNLKISQNLSNMNNESRDLRLIVEKLSRDITELREFEISKIVESENVPLFDDKIKAIAGFLILGFLFYYGIKALPLLSLKKKEMGSVVNLSDQENGTIGIENIRETISAGTPRIEGDTLYIDVPVPRGSLTGIGEIEIPIPQGSLTGIGENIPVATAIPDILPSVNSYPPGSLPSSQEIYAALEGITHLPGGFPGGFGM